MTRRLYAEFAPHARGGHGGFTGGGGSMPGIGGAVSARTTTMSRMSRPARHCALFLALSPAALPAAAAGFSGTAALTSDYVWRGTSQSNEDPAVQGGFKVAGDSGLYAQAWGSSVEFAPETRASSEVDLVVGWSGALSEALALDVNLTRYWYPSAAVDLDWTEAIATLTLHDNYWLQVGHSNDALASDERGTYAQVGARFPLTESIRIEAAAGHYWLDTAGGYDDYAHAQLGGVWAFPSPFELRLTVHDTDASADRVFGPWAGSRVEAAIQASF